MLLNVIKNKHSLFFDPGLKNLISCVRGVHALFIVLLSFQILQILVEVFRQEKKYIGPSKAIGSMFSKIFFASNPIAN